MALLILIVMYAYAGVGEAAPPPVEVRPEPERVMLGDPAFEPLPGVRADFGRLGGSVYQIEVPARWNGRLVLYMHGFEEFSSTADVTAPDIRRYLIGREFAWGASSFSSTSLIPGRAPRARRRFEDVIVSLTGGPRAFDRAGFRLEEETNCGAPSCSLPQESRGSEPRSPRCARGATITFRVDGRLAWDTAVNEPERSGSLDLTVP